MANPTIPVKQSDDTTNELADATVITMASEKTEPKAQQSEDEVESELGPPKFKFSIEV